MGGEVAGQVVPGDSVADFVEDGFEDEAIVEGRATAQVLRRRGVREAGGWTTGRQSALRFLDWGF